MDNSQNEVEISDEKFNEYFHSKGEASLEDNTDETINESSDEKTEEKEAPGNNEETQPDVELDSIIKERDNYKKAMAEERAQRKEFQQELQRLKELEEKLEALSKGSQNEEVDYDDDPVEALKRKQEMLDSKQKEYDEYIKSQKETQELQSRYSKFESDVSSQTKQFSEKNPDYIDAYNFLMKSRADELRSMRYRDDEIVNVMAQEEMSIAWRALQEGINPAAVVYDIARQRGFNSVIKENIAKSSEKIDNIERGAALSKSLGSRSGGDAVDFSADSLEGMSDEEMDKYVSDPKKWEMLKSAM